MFLFFLLRLSSNLLEMWAKFISEYMYVYMPLKLI